VKRHGPGLLGTAWLLFVLGGGLVGWSGLTSLGQLPRTSAVTIAAPQSPTPPVLRDFDLEPPPFAAAGEPVPVPVPTLARTDTTPLPASTAAPLPSPTPSPELATPAGRLTILLLGIDQRPDEAAAADGDPGRTDTMALASVDYEAHTATLASIPRDGYVVIPSHGKDRINAAYTFGEVDQRGAGPALAKQTVSQVFGVRVDRYALVDIHTMERIIDAVGGVWIDNPTRLVDRAYPTDDYRTKTVDIPAGKQLMDGQLAVEYARTRHVDSDFGRQGRQQQVLLALRDRALQPDVLPRVPALLAELPHLVRTDLTPLEIAQLAAFGRALDPERDIATLKPDGALTPIYVGPGGASYVNLTPAFRAAVRGLVAGPPSG